MAPAALSRTAACLAALLLCASCLPLTLQQELSTSASVQGPKGSVEASYTGKVPYDLGGGGSSDSDGASGGNGGGSVAGGAISDAFDGMLSQVRAAVQGSLDAARQRLGEKLTQAGVSPGAYVSLLAPLAASTKNMLDGVLAVRGAYEKTLEGVFGLVLDNTNELRKAAEDGNAVIDTIRTLRGAKCDEASFEPPTAKPARLTGAGGKYKVSSGSCVLKRAASPLKRDIELSCTEPTVSYDTKAPTFTSHYVSAATATTEECKVERKYGVESETTIVLFDPASFFAKAKAEGGPDAEAASGAGADADAKAAGWFRELFPTGDRASFLPPGVADLVAKAVKEVAVETTLSYKPFSIRHDMQDAAESIARALSGQFEVTRQAVKVYREAAESWLDGDKLAKMREDLDFGGNLRESMAELNVSSLFDGVFAKTASQLLDKTRLAGKAGKGQLLSQAMGAAGQLAASDRPLRALLAQVRESAGKPVSFDGTTTLGKVVEAARGAGVAAADGLSSAAAAVADGGALQGLLSVDPKLGERLKQLAGMLGSPAAAAAAASGA